MSSLIFLLCALNVTKAMLKGYTEYLLFLVLREKKVGKFSLALMVYSTVLLVVPGNFVVYCTVTGLEGFHPRSQAEQCPK
jgi:hypothetical protein